MIKHNDCRVIYDEGMPVHKSPDQRGDLIIDFKVEFPSTIPIKNVATLSQLLPERPELPITPSDAKQIRLLPIQPEYQNSTSGMMNHILMNHDDDEEGGPQQVRCQTQ